MSPIARTRSQPLSAATAAIIRTNLRSAREAQGLTRDQAIARIEQPTITTTALGKAETGDRNITAPELAQLAVAYQIPIQCFFLSWSGDAANRPILSGADFKASSQVIEDWLLTGKYPTYPDAITRTGSAIQGAINARLFTNPKALLTLNKTPTPETYTKLALAELDNLLNPLKREVETYTASAIELCGFDLFPLLESTTQTDYETALPAGLIEQLADSITANPDHRLNKLESLHSTAKELFYSYSSNYVTDCIYSTIEDLWDLQKKINIITQPLQHHGTITNAVKLAYKSNK